MVIEVFFPIAVDVCHRFVALYPTECMFDHHALTVEDFVLCFLFIAELAAFRFLMRQMNILVFFFKPLEAQVSLNLTILAAYFATGLWMNPAKNFAQSLRSY